MSCEGINRVGAVATLSALLEASIDWVRVLNRDRATRPDSFDVLSQARVLLLSSEFLAVPKFIWHASYPICACL